MSCEFNKEGDCTLTLIQKCCKNDKDNCKRYQKHLEYVKQPKPLTKWNHKLLRREFVERGEL